MMPDPQYATDALTWLLIWTGAGLFVREYLAGKGRSDRRRTNRAARR